LQIAEESYENAPPMSSTDEVDRGKARRTSSQSPPGSAGYVRQQSARYTKDPCVDGGEAELWPDTQPPPVPTSAAAAKANQQGPKTDSDGYLETSIGATYDDRCSGYLDAVEPVPSGIIFETL